MRGAACICLLRENTDFEGVQEVGIDKKPSGSYVMYELPERVGGITHGKALAPQSGLV